MKEWCLEHPYLTASLLFVLMVQTHALLVSIIGLFKKPDPVTFNIKANVPKPDPFPGSDDLN